MKQKEPLDKPTRNLLAKLVATWRDGLASDTGDQLRSTCGLYLDSAVPDVLRTEDDRRAAEGLRKWLPFRDTSSLRSLMDSWVGAMAQAVSWPCAPKTCAGGG